LFPSATAVQEPANPTFKQPRAPTINAKDAKFVPKKYEFDEVFTIPSFEGKRYVYEIDRRKNIKLDTKTKRPKKKEVSRTKGCVNEDFKKKHGLSSKSMPWDFVDAFIPFKENKRVSERDHFSFEKMTRWTNNKAILAGAGSTTYHDFKPFTPQEIRQHFGIYVLHGIQPSPRVEYKFRSQRQDPVSGNDFVFSSFGPNAERRHKHFKAFLSCVNPAIDPPSRDTHPNWKVRALIKWINKISPEAWSCACQIAVDEMTMRFKGHHRDKLRITFKAEGDGFMADALCDDGYCYQIYFRNDPAPKKYLDMGLSPLLARTMFLFDALRDEHHCCGMDNLYNSAAFCKYAYNHKNSVLVHGVTRKWGRGIPDCVLQEEVINRNAQIAVRGTVKAAKLVGDPDCPNLIASSVYDTKPVHYLSMVSKSIKWKKLERKVFNVETNQVETMEFLRLNQIDAYNHGMGDVDLADQLRGVYRLDRWVRNRKWWWSMLFFSIGVLLTNAYKVYLRVNEDEGITTKSNGLMSHYEFRKAIALYWINDKEALKIYSCGATTAAPGAATFQSPTSVSTMSGSDNDYTITSSIGSDKRAPPVNDGSLNEYGRLKRRLDRSLRHFPRRATGRPYCCIHKWLGYRTEKQTMYCPDCNVHLCVDCYTPFHECVDMVGAKPYFASLFLEDAKPVAAKKRRRT